MRVILSVFLIQARRLKVVLARCLRHRPVSQYWRYSRVECAGVSIVAESQVVVVYNAALVLSAENINILFEQGF